MCLSVLLPLLCLLPCLSTFLPGLTYVPPTATRPTLQSHPSCGLQTRGQVEKPTIFHPFLPQDECFFDCNVTLSLSGLFMPGTRILYLASIANPQCLRDCFSSDPKAPDFCMTSLLDAVLSKGICDRPLDDPKQEEAVHPAKEAFPGLSISASCSSTPAGSLTSDTCPSSTQDLVSSRRCKLAVIEQAAPVLSTIAALLYLSNCVSSLRFITDIGDGARRRKAASAKKRAKAKKRKQGKARGNKQSGRVSRLNPLFLANEQAGVRTRLDYSHTRHRYPWICSLRTSSQPPQHLCAVTLLSSPPQSFVVVGPAHCTYICKNEEGHQIPACCCHVGRPSSCGQEVVTCGRTPRVATMEPVDSHILCGEWQLGEVPMELSQEEYNIRLSITEIVRHPGFNLSMGPLGGSDIAVFKVRAESGLSNLTKLVPACLPRRNRPSTTEGLHSGWANPPPFYFLQQYTPQLLRYYADFFKQWHYKMDIQQQCDDAQLSAFIIRPLMFPSHSYYPPGTVCAKHSFRATCFATGDSGKYQCTFLIISSTP